MLRVKLTSQESRGADAQPTGAPAPALNTHSSANFQLTSNSMLDGILGASGGGDVMLGSVQLDSLPVAIPKPTPAPAQDKGKDSTATEEKSVTKKDASSHEANKPDDSPPEESSSRRRKRARRRKKKPKPDSQPAEASPTAPGEAKKKEPVVPVRTSILKFPEGLTIPKGMQEEEARKFYDLIRETVFDLTTETSQMVERAAESEGNAFKISPVRMANKLFQKVGLKAVQKLIDHAK